MEPQKPKKSMTFTQASNWLEAEKKKDARAEARKAVKGAAISYSSPRDREKYLLYCISLCPDIRTRAVLTLVKIYGWSYERIAHFLQHKAGYGTTTIADVKKAEEEGLRRVKDAIVQARKTRLPIIGGNN